MIALYNFIAHYCPNCGAPADLADALPEHARDRHSPEWLAARLTVRPGNRCLRCSLVFHVVANETLDQMTGWQVIQTQVRSDCARQLRARVDGLEQLGVHPIQIMAGCRELADRWHGRPIHWCSACGTYTDSPHQPDVVCRTIGEPEVQH